MNEMTSEIQVVVGCGGLLFHAMSGMACEAKMRRGDYQAASASYFMDGDQIEARNMERQAWGYWPDPVKEEAYGFPFKSALACRAWDALCPVRGAIGDSRMLTEAGTLVRLVRGESAVSTVKCRVVIIALPDNDEARVTALNEAAMIARKGECEVWYVTAGNHLRGGQAWGMKWNGEAGMWADPKRVAGWDIFRPSEEESQVEREEVHCAEQQDQSMESNMQTAVLICKVLKRLRVGMFNHVELYWEHKGADTTPPWGAHIKDLCVTETWTEYRS